MSVTRADLLSFARGYRYAIESSVGPDNRPQSAIVGVAISDAFEIVFDTLESSRKAQNLRLRPGISFVVGSTTHDARRTLQFEGIADEPTGPDRERLVRLYLGVFPDGLERQSWPGLAYFRVKPLWIRYSDYRQEPPEIIELDRRRLEDLQ
jgi:hypothetical protein